MPDKENSVPRTKDEIFAAVKHYQQVLKEKGGLDLNVSDEQILKNIDKKQNYYLSCVAYNENLNHREKTNAQALKQDGIKYRNYLRSTDLATIPSNELESFKKEMNSQIKQDHYYAKKVEEVGKANFSEIADMIISHPENLVDYMNENTSLFEVGFGATSIVNKKQGSKFSKDLQNIITENSKVFEGVFAQAKSVISFNSSPLTFLFNEYVPNSLLSEKFADAASNVLYSRGGNSKEPPEMDIVTALSQASDACNSKDIRALKAGLKAAGVKENLIFYKSSVKGETLQDALMNKHDLKPCSEEEKKAIQDEFNKFDMAYLKNKLDHPEDSNIEENDRQKFEEWNKTHAPDEIYAGLNPSVYTDGSVKVDEAVEMKDLGEKEVSNVVNEEPVRKEITDLEKDLEAPSKQQKSSTVDDRKKLAEEINKAFEDEEANEKKEKLDRVVDLEMRLSKKSGIAKFFAAILPDAWTETGRIKRDLKREKAEFLRDFGTQEDINEALVEAKTQEDLGKAKPQEEIEHVQPFVVKKQVDMENDVKEENSIVNENTAEMSEKVKEDEPMMNIPNK